jgi:hypothetical protein
MRSPPNVPRWSDLASVSDRPRLKVELAKDGTTPDDLVLDVQDVPALHAQCERLEGDDEALLLLALQWFGDEGNPQPEQRREWPGIAIW